VLHISIQKSEYMIQPVFSVCATLLIWHVFISQLSVSRSVVVLRSLQLRWTVDVVCSRSSASRNDRQLHTERTVAPSPAGH